VPARGVTPNTASTSPTCVSVAMEKLSGGRFRRTASGRRRRPDAGDGDRNDRV
jgi:hypothetical protein